LAGLVLTYRKGRASPGPEVSTTRTAWIDRGPRLLGGCYSLRLDGIRGWQGLIAQRTFSTEAALGGPSTESHARPVDGSRSSAGLPPRPNFSRDRFVAIGLKLNYSSPRWAEAGMILGANPLLRQVSGTAHLFGSTRRGTGQFRRLPAGEPEEGRLRGGRLGRFRQSGAPVHVDVEPGGCPWKEIAG